MTPHALSSGTQSVLVQIEPRPVIGEAAIRKDDALMRVLIACDSFKGSLSSAQAAAHISIGLRRVYPDAEIDSIPMADGGEGTALALTSALGGTYHAVRVQGPLGEPVEAGFGLLPGGEAVMDMASASGLTLVPDGKNDILSASTFGTGQLILSALDKGCRHIYLGIGGSATNDGGLGLAQALGVRFLDSRGNILGDAPGCALAGKHLADVAAVDLSRIDPRLADVGISVLCDVTNPLCGSTGAAHIYGPQKGAGPAVIQQLDEGLASLSRIVLRDLGLDLADTPGAGAAGGLGFGLMAFTGARLIPGADFLLDASCFDDKARLANLVVTGEGKLDHQSALGKTPARVASRAAALGVPVVALGGAIEGSLDALYQVGITAAEACVCAPMRLEDAMANAGPYLVDAAERIMRAIALGTRLGNSADLITII